MDSKNFIIDDNVLVAYIGPADITEMVIPEGVESVASDFIQQKLTNEIKLTIPSSLKSFDFLNAFLKVKELVIPAETQLEVLKINLSSKEITLPKTIKTVAINGHSPYDESGDGAMEVVRFVSGTVLEYLFISDVQYLILPKDIKIVKENEWHILNINISRVPYMFYEGRLTKSLREALLGTYNSAKCLFLYENQDINAIEFVSKKGIDYFKTANGIIVTEINNKVAKLEDLPTELDGVAVVDYNIKEIWDDLYGDHIDKYKSSLGYKSGNYKRDELAEKYGVLYPRLVYKYKKIYALADETVPTAIAERNAQNQRETNKRAKKNEIESKKTEIKSSKTGASIGIKLGISALIAWILSALFGGYVLGSLHLDTTSILWYILNFSIIRFAILFVIISAITFGISAIIRRAKKSKIKKLEQEINQKSQELSKESQENELTELAELAEMDGDEKMRQQLLNEVAELRAGKTQEQESITKAEQKPTTVKGMLATYPNFEQACRVYIKNIIDIKDQNARECARLEQDIKRLSAEIADIAVNGTKEQQEKRAMEKRFSDLTDAIRESGKSSSSYNVYDEYGSKIGEIKND